MNSSDRQLKIIVLGLRGFPSIMGGIEKHCEYLYPNLVKLGFHVEVVVRTPYFSNSRRRQWHGVFFRRIWAPRHWLFETIIHTFLGVLYAGLKRPDIVHIHGVGPAVFAPLTRMLGLKVIVTHHGPDYEREKWGSVAKFVLRLGERLGVIYSNGCIAITQVVKQLIAHKYGRDSTLIYYGVPLPEVVSGTQTLDTYGLKSKKYILNVARLVPEKRQLDIIQAFEQAKLDGWTLVIAGNSDHPNEYSREVVELAEKTTDVVYVGFQTGTALSELFANSGLFVLASTHEGLPLALLEALGYGIPPLVSDIPAFIEAGLPQKYYFPVGSIPQLANRMGALTAYPATADECASYQEIIRSRHDWQSIAEKTKDLYLSIVWDG